MVIFLVYPNATQGRRGVMRQKIAVPTEFLLPHYISTKQKHFLNLFKTVEA